MSLTSIVLVFAIASALRDFISKRGTSCHSHTDTDHFSQLRRYVSVLPVATSATVVTPAPTLSGLAFPASSCRST
jgi:hypothetical protein